MLQSVLQCRALPDPLRARHPNMLHVPLRYACGPPLNLTLAWVPHAYPFYTGVARWSDSRVKRSPGAVLDGLSGGRGEGKVLVLLHLFIHFSPLHTAVMARHVRDAARAVRALLRRQPGVRVAVRGPHAVCGDQYCLAGELHVQRSLRVLRREFGALRGRVLLLDARDMTVALGSCGLHPPRPVVTALLRLLLAHLCPTRG